MAESTKHVFDVTPQMSAEAFGNAGFPVLATPALLGLFERAAIAAMSDRLSEGQGSVGTEANLKHLAATLVGGRVTIDARIVEADGRRIEFELEAHDETQRIGVCRHQRFIVDVAKFRDRLAGKAAG